MILERLADDALNHAGGVEDDEIGRAAGDVDEGAGADDVGQDNALGLRRAHEAQLVRLVQALEVMGRLDPLQADAGRRPDRRGADVGVHEGHTARTSQRVPEKVLGEAGLAGIGAADEHYHAALADDPLTQ